METIKIRDEFIKLGQALKAAGLVESGVEAKIVIQNGEVLVNGRPELQRGKKLTGGEVISYNGQEIRIEKKFAGVTVIIESVDLKDYRNYKILNMNFNPQINIIYGDNAQGKTNILEALYVCATSRSHKGSKDREMIRMGSDEAHIKLNVKKNGLPYRIDMHLKKNKSKGIAVNGIPIKRAVELFGILNIVCFSPEDLSIIKNGPAERRRFMDMELSQLDKIYLSNLINYNKVVNQRNKLLKALSYKSSEEKLETLDIWDLQLVKYGTEVMKRRVGFVQELNEIIGGLHEKLSGGTEKLMIEYQPCVEDTTFLVTVT